ncbi:MAG: YfcC family protein [Clostridiales bacterium]|uniref:YfcC family protein n=1 Tax=Terrisporobacter sp. TaxID=1965305 RepID=UPI002A3D3629|nr:YfcC family protein [Terrisporobacter sp.]MCI5629046.1 YfcC family protein [Clostridium sp.]MDD5879416.1 YfcC family protein [Clostridiales bacterium]MCI6457917.1 YfcC family protein [Clostridium sp.]MCI7207545.1 YfcC family protein [Clostridium sp.]MDY4736673.1 YfcC family protein [Terrisporobacter sp.]
MESTLNKKKFTLPTAYTVLLIITALIALATQFIPGVQAAKLSDLVMAPINGLNEAIDIAIFVLLIGGFLGVTTYTGALDAGIGSVVEKLQGRELVLIPVLMFIFSLGGTSFGMAEETIAFAALVTTTMIVAGFDPLVSVATLILGSGCGVLGSTVNPFLVSTSIGALNGVGIEVNQVIVIGTGIALWLSSLLISIYFVMKYAKKVQKDKSATLLSEKEMNDAKEAFIGNKDSEEVVEFTTKRRIVLGLFALTFIVMVAAIIPWEEFGVTIFAKTDFLTGSALGSWWFSELAMWFVIMSVIIGLVYQMKEQEIVSAFMNGAADMVGVALVIGVSKGISVMMSTTGLDNYVLSSASSLLSGMSPIVFTIVAFIIYMVLSFFVPSTSGLAGLSMPIFGPLAVSLGFSSEVIISIFSAGSGLVNLVTPTSGVIMGALAIAKVDYASWVKFVSKVLVAIFISSAIILSIAMILL